MRKSGLCLSFLWLAALAIVLFACADSTSSQDIPSLPGTQDLEDLDVPYVPTPQSVVDRMLELADVEAGDYVIDLGSGDGRIVITAAKRGATGHGVDLDPERIREAAQNAQKAGVANQVLFLQEDIFLTDFSKASVITMYLLPSVNLKLRPRLLGELRPGTRVVSHSFDMAEWTPDASETMDAEGDEHSIFLWVIPAKMEGQWHWSLDGNAYTMDVKQEYQELELQIRAGNQNFETSTTYLKGRRVTFATHLDSQSFLYSGRVDNDEIMGIVQIRQGDHQRLGTWTAEKDSLP